MDGDTTSREGEFPAPEIGLRANDPVQATIRSLAKMQNPVSGRCFSVLIDAGTSNVAGTRAEPRGGAPGPRALPRGSARHPFIPDRATLPCMSVCIVFHSETGNTRTVAERLAPLVGGDLIEVTDLAHYSKISRYIGGGRRAMKGESATIEPATIDVTACDTVVVGTPVWAGNPTPAINAAIEALVGIEGKSTVVFCTSGGMPGKTLETVTAMLAGRGADVRGAVPFTARDVQKGEGVEALADLILRAKRGFDASAEPSR